MRDPALLPVSDPVLPPSPTALHIERVDFATLERHQAAWKDLAERAIEPNIFLEPGFAVPLLRHLGLSKRFEFLLVWDQGETPALARLLALLPVVPPAGALKLAGIARGWAHNQVCSGVPLIDGARASEVLDALLARLSESRLASALALSLVPKEGAFFAALAAACARSSRSFAVVDEHPRAFLSHDGGAARVETSVSSKRRKEHARLSRRLSDLGVRIYTSAVTPAELASATERFLALEHAGWKGSGGTSFLSDPARAMFLRSLLQDLAADGKCRIDSIDLDGRPVAMGIVLTTGDRASYWKTAFDECHAPLSPGVLFTLDLTKRQLADRTLASTDSCAIADHPMIDRLWPDRLVVCDLLVGLRAGDRRLFNRAMRIDALHRSLRRRAKATLHRLRRLRAG